MLSAWLTGQATLYFRCRPDRVGPQHVTQDSAVEVFRCQPPARALDPKYVTLSPSHICSPGKLGTGTKAHPVSTKYQLIHGATYALNHASASGLTRACMQIVHRLGGTKNWKPPPGPTRTQSVPHVCGLAAMLAHSTLAVVLKQNTRRVSDSAIVFTPFQILF